MGGENTKKVFTLADVSQHNTAKDCWLVIHNKVMLLSSSFSFLGFT
jgi:cytochrome b involved in lipid metabolism